MTNEMISPETKLKEAREALEQERIHLQVIGRALTPEERIRADALGQAVPLLDEALTVLGTTGLEEMLEK